MGSDTAQSASQSLTIKDSEAIAYLRASIESGMHWYKALLGAMGRWTSAEEQHDGRFYRYLIEGEAFDWLLLAERLCAEVDRLLSADEKEALLFYGKPPITLTAEQVKKLIGATKYAQYLNYFYGITVETALILAVEEEVHKEWRSLCCRHEADTTDEAYRRIYGETKSALLRKFRREKGYPHLKSTTLTELKEFTYYLFKYRLEHSEKPKVASDTRKALERLSQHWTIGGLVGIPVGKCAPC